VVGWNSYDRTGFQQNITRGKITGYNGRMLTRVKEDWQEAKRRRRPARQEGITSSSLIKTRHYGQEPKRRLNPHPIYQRNRKRVGDQNSTRKTRNKNATIRRGAIEHTDRVKERIR